MSRKPSELKNEELKIWLRCRGDPAKGLKTKAELVKRWEYLPRALFLFVYVCQLLTYRGDFIVYDHSSLSFRVEQYIETGRDKNVVDPNPSGLYTKRKQQRYGSQIQGDKTTSSVDYPTDGWSTSLAKLPVLTRGEMNEYIARSGKKTLGINITTLCQLLFEKRRHFWKTNTSTKYWQPVIRSGFILRLNAIIALGKTIRHINWSLLCAL